MGTPFLFKLEENLFMGVSSFKKSPFNAGNPKTFWCGNALLIIPEMVPPVPTAQHM